MILEIVHLRAELFQTSLFLTPLTLYLGEFLLGCGSILACLSNRALELILFDSQCLCLVDKTSVFCPSLVPIAAEQAIFECLQLMDLLLERVPLCEFRILSDLLPQALRLTAELLDRGVTLEYLRESLPILLARSFEFIESFELPVRRISHIVASQFKQCVIRICRRVTHDAAQDVVGQGARLLAKESDESFAISGFETRPGSVPMARFLVSGENEGEPLVPAQHRLGLREICKCGLQSHYFTFLAASCKF